MIHSIIYHDGCILIEKEVIKESHGKEQIRYEEQDGRDRLNDKINIIGIYLQKK